MARKQPRSGVGVRILMGVARVLAAAVIAVAASAALADLDVRPIEFSRILPVVLTGEGIIYILMLGGGSVAAPILLLSVILSFVVRAGIAVAAGALSPQVTGDLLASAQFYYASYWPAAAAQVLMMAVALRLIRPLIATRVRRRRRGRPQVSDALHDSRREAERQDVLLKALAENTDEPPVSPTVLEERQIGDLAEVVEREAGEEDVPEAPALPFDEEEPEEVEAEAAPEDAEEEALPPGVIDATPEAAMRASADETDGGSVPEPDAEIEETPEPGSEDEQVPGESPSTEAADEPGELPAETAEAAEEVAQPPETAAPESAPGEDTARLSPVEPAPPVDGAEPERPENLRGMIDVISDAAGAGTDVRVWRTSDGRTVIAAVPSGTPAAGTGGHADALVSAHLEICAWLGAGPTAQQLSATAIGAWALQALDPAATTVLIMAARGETAAGRIQLAAAGVAQAVREFVEAADTDRAPDRPAEAASALPLSPEAQLGEMLDAASADAGGRFGTGWNAWRGPHRRIIAVAPDGDAETTARKVARMVAPIERFADAVALDGPDWTVISAGERLLASHWAEYDGESIVLAATVSGEAAIGRVRWELDEIARLMQQQ
ncbi:MAG: hypothetical protein R6V07_02205 [Armatimonadota bacterium]